MVDDLRYPETAVLYRRLTRSYPLIVRGEGCWLFDDQGNKYLDACSGAYVANLGHGVGEIADAVAGQMRRLAYVNGTAFTNQPTEKLAQAIAERSPKGLDKVFFLCSGTDVVEAAIKLARQHWAELNQPSKQKVIATSPSYHGGTLLALSASGRRQYKTFFQGWLIDFPKIPAPYPYRQEAGSAPLTGVALEKRILREGAENVAAFIAEPVGGSSTGASLPPADYWKQIRAVCDKYQVLLIVDEVLTGVGRTGTWSALEPYGIAPDMQLLAKGLTGGYAALSALVTTRRVIDPVAAGTGAVLHNQTFSHHPVMCAAGLATLEHLSKYGLIERSAEMGTVLLNKLSALKTHPNVGDVRGRGLLACVEFVEDKASKRPFPRKHHFAETFAAIAQGMGLVVWQNNSQADGTNGDLAMLAPPFIISESEIDRIVEIFSNALKQTIKTLHSEV
jgi:adenosylmethionine-8-amino-7-oxononanoate aminotransferase